MPTVERDEAGTLTIQVVEHEGEHRVRVAIFGSDHALATYFHAGQIQQLIQMFETAAEQIEEAEDGEGGDPVDLDHEHHRVQ